MNEIWNDTVDVFTNRWPTIWSLFLEHATLSLISIGIAILISVPLGIILTRNTKIAEPIIGVASVLQTIPSLALLVFLVPFMGTGKAPAIIALTIYGLLPILRNTYIGIRGVDRATVEAGIGMGMTSRQVLTMVELPLSLGVIMAGVRTATVLIVGVATIAGLIGAGGLGDLIFRGLQTYNSGLILAGAIPSALLAIVLDFILKKVEGMAQPGKLSRTAKKNITRGAIAVVAAIVLVFAVTSFTGDTKDTITITGKNFTEQEIMVFMLGHLIEEKTDLNVKYESFLGGSTLAFEGLQQGSYDVYVEYTGTGLMNYLKEDAINDPDKAYDYVKKVFKEKYDLVWLDPIGFNNTYTLTVRQEDAKKYGLEKMSDLEKTADSMVLGTEPEFQERKDGYPGFQELYGFSFKEAKTMDTGIMYSAIKNGDVDVIDAFGTDGRIPAFNLKVLEDDKKLFPPYYAAPLIRQDVLDKHPELEEVLNMLAGRIDDERMQELNARVDIDKEEYETVAVDFLKEEGLIE